MDFDDPNNNKPELVTPDLDDPQTEHPNQDTKFNNILKMIGSKKPSLRLVKLLGTSSAKILPFKRPLGLIVGGLALSAYALI